LRLLWRCSSTTILAGGAIEHPVLIRLTGLVQNVGGIVELSVWWPQSSSEHFLHNSTKASF